MKYYVAVVEINRAYDHRERQELRDHFDPLITRALGLEGTIISSAVEEPFRGDPTAMVAREIAQCIIQRERKHG